MTNLGRNNWTDLCINKVTHLSKHKFVKTAQQYLNLYSDVNVLTNYENWEYIWIYICYICLILPHFIYVTILVTIFIYFCFFNHIFLIYNIDSVTFIHYVTSRGPFKEFKSSLFMFATRQTPAFNIFPPEIIPYFDSSFVPHIIVFLFLFKIPFPLILYPLF